MGGYGLDLVIPVDMRLGKVKDDGVATEGSLGGEGFGGGSSRLVSILRCYGIHASIPEFQASLAFDKTCMSHDWRGS